MLRKCEADEAVRGLVSGGQVSLVGGTASAEILRWLCAGSI